MHPRVRRGGWTREAGFGFVAVLLALLIAAALYFGYFGMQGGQRKGSSRAPAMDGARDVACRANRQAMEREVMAWSVNHLDEEPTIGALQAAGVRIPSCPGGGSYDLVGREVRCSVHR